MPVEADQLGACSVGERHLSPTWVGTENNESKILILASLSPNSLGLSETNSLFSDLHICWRLNLPLFLKFAAHHRNFFLYHPLI